MNTDNKEAKNLIDAENLRPETDDKEFKDTDESAALSNTMKMLPINKVGYTIVEFFYYLFFNDNG